MRSILFVHEFHENPVTTVALGPTRNDIMTSNCEGAHQIIHGIVSELGHGYLGPSDDLERNVATHVPEPKDGQTDHCFAEVFEEEAQGT